MTLNPSISLAADTLILPEDHTHATLPIIQTDSIHHLLLPLSILLSSYTPLICQQCSYIILCLELRLPTHLISFWHPLTYQWFYHLLSFFFFLELLLPTRCYAFGTLLCLCLLWQHAVPLGYCIAYHWICLITSSGKLCGRPFLQSTYLTLFKLVHISNDYFNIFCVGAAPSFSLWSL